MEIKIKKVYNGYILEDKTYYTPETKVYLNFFDLIDELAFIFDERTTEEKIMMVKEKKGG